MYYNKRFINLWSLKKSWYLILFVLHLLTDLYYWLRNHLRGLHCRHYFSHQEGYCLFVSYAFSENNIIRFNEINQLNWESLDIIDILPNFVIHLRAGVGRDVHSIGSPMHLGYISSPHVKCFPHLPFHHSLWMLNDVGLHQETFYTNGNLGSYKYSSYVHSPPYSKDNDESNNNKNNNNNNDDTNGHCKWRKNSKEEN